MSVVRNSELRKRIKDKDKETIEAEFKRLFESLDKSLPMGDYFDIGRFVRELRDYVLEEVE